MNLQPPVLETGALPVELRPWVAEANGTAASEWQHPGVQRRLLGLLFAALAAGLTLIAVFSACLVPPINAQQAPVPQPRQAEGEAPGVDPQLNLIVQGVVTAAGRLAVAAAVTVGTNPLPRPRPDVLAQDIVAADETAAAAAAPEPEPQADLQQQKTGQGGAGP